MTRTSATGLVLTEPRSFERRSFDLPDVGEDDGLLRVEACGLCGIDHEQYTGHITNPHVFIPGHEGIGIVAVAQGTTTIVAPKNAS
ncbi:alcohol dehydrogenase catalytic domain-containing protein [Candidatus Poriferisodalis sp.]|uniref:alcohol dehydrogenase catalytic domain-containing protein n=1 Tax=Candidatus Poriferisodalis sp. TaxID=3101277 RepID=UPI003B5158EC